MGFQQAPPGRGQFSDLGQSSGVQQGFKDATIHDPLDKKFVIRNLKPFKTLSRFASTKGLKKLKHKNTSQLERLSARAVLKKAKIKSSPLDTSVNRKKFKPKAITKARKALKAIGPGAFRPGSTAGIKNKRVRRAANHLRQIRRNRRVNKTPVGSVKAYDIFKGYIRK